MSEFYVEYGRALYSLSIDEGICEKVKDELLVIEELFCEHKEYVKLLDTPGIELKKRIELVDEAFSGFEEILVNFIKLLAEKKATGEFIKCKKEFMKMYDSDNNIERVIAYSAVPISEDKLLKIKEKLEVSLNKNICITNKISKDIIGGVLIKLANSEIDGSIKGRLQNMGKQLKEIVF